MTALATDKEVAEKSAEDIQIVPIAAATTIYKGALCMINAAGYLAPCTPTATSQFAGVAAEGKNNSAGAAGDLSARVYRHGRFAVVAAGQTQANVGDAAYAADDQTIGSSTTNAQYVGTVCEFVSATEVRVDISSATGTPTLHA